MAIHDLRGLFIGDMQAHAQIDRPGIVVIPDALFALPSSDIGALVSQPVAADHMPPPSVDAKPSPDGTTREPQASPNRSGGRPTVRRIVTHAEQTVLQWPPVIGSVIDGKYELVEHVGSGGFAEVYRAIHRVLRSEVALKMLKPMVIRDRPDAIDMMCNEARMLVRLAHPNIVRVIDITKLDGLVFIVMEYVEGSTLAEIMVDWKKLDRGERVPESFALRVAEGVCAGLDSACRLGAIHRDIKPSNIMIQDPSQSGSALRPADLVTGKAISPKIVDLGLARTAGVEGLTGSESDTIGTPLYMPPEQVLDPAKVDHRSDMYALGCTLFHLLAGRPPYMGNDAREIMLAHVQAPIPSVKSLNRLVTDEFAALIADCMAKDQSGRPANWREVGERISNIMRPSSGARFLRRLSDTFGV